MIKSIAIFLTEYLAENNKLLTKKDILKIEYSLQVILGDLTKFIIIFSIFSALKQLPLFLWCFVILISTRPLIGGLSL